MSFDSEGVVDLIDGYPGFLPGVAASLALAFVLAAPVARALGTRVAVAAILIVSIGVVLAATLTAGPEAGDPDAKGGIVCEFTRPTFPQLVGIDEETLNAVLLFPFGLVIGLVPRSRRKIALVTCALVVPFAIEFIQAVAPMLDRACQSRDVIDNLAGLVTGLSIGSLLGRLRPGLADSARGPR